MKVAVVIPWWEGTTCKWRIRWREQVVALWLSRGYPVLLAESEAREGEARNRGVEMAAEEGYEIIVCTDADAIVTEQAASRAVWEARNAPGLVVPHNRYVYLSEEASEHTSAGEVAETLAASDGEWRKPMRSVEAIGDNSVGGPTVFSVATWEQAGGYDPKIVRAYDGAFALACGTLVAPQRRLPGDFLHLWHPREEGEDPPSTWETIRAYHEAAALGKDAMRRLVERRKL